MLNKITNKDIQFFVDRYCSDIKGFNKDQFVHETIELKRRIRGAKNTDVPVCDAIMERWYKSLNDRNPDYGVYSDVSVLQDVWACWAMYSRAYLKALPTRIVKSTQKNIMDSFGKVSSILDIGNGIGYSTATLSQLFPKAKVFGYNVKGSFQYKICSKVAADYRFTMIDNIRYVKNIDLLFASEYFEHFEEPIKHLSEVIKLLKPKNIVVANSFGTKSIGHFDSYILNGIVIGPRQTRREFNMFLKINNYKKHKTNCWNDRPAFWSIEK